MTHCGTRAIKVCSCVGFESWVCRSCGTVFDLFECGHAVMVRQEDIAEAALGRCPTCGWNRLALRKDGRRANASGEGAMRAGGLGMARRIHDRGY